VNGLERLASPDGVFCMLALDHRDALRNAFRRAGVEDVSAETMLELKRRIASALGADASGILLDHAAVGCRPDHAGLLVPLEAQSHEPLEGGRLNALEFDGADARRVGADGCKLLLWYRADHDATAARQRELVARAADDCHRHDLPLVLEPLVYQLEGEKDKAYRRALPGLIVAAADELAGSGADLLKLQFPGKDACAAVTRAASPLRWALLGGSEVDGATFAAQLETACRAGAAGFIAGRAIWTGALGLPADEQEAWLAREARLLFARLAAIAHHTIV
jgi:tagatose-1,6-bisphosphate aldolase